MLAFALSKMNLLIFVTAIFAIVAFFMFGLTDIVVANTAQQIANAKAEQALGIANSNKLCFSSNINMPSAIYYFGNAREFFYAMKISREPVETVAGQKNTLIFAIVNRRTQDRIIAAKSIETDSEIVLFGWDPKAGIFAPDKETIVIDPQAETPVNSFILVKEVYNGKNYLYVIACSFSEDFCKANKALAGQKIQSGEVTAINPNVLPHKSLCFE